MKIAFWLNVGVQIFFIISGLLYGYKDISNFKKFWKSKFFKIILPYFIVIISYFSYLIITNNKMFSLTDIIYYFTMSQAFNTNISSLAHLWFISYILLFYLLIPILQKFDISNSKNFYIKLILLIIGLQLLQFLNVININVSYISLFIVSYYFSRRYFKYNIKDNYKKIFYITLFITFIGIPIQIILENQTLSGIFYKLYIIFHDYIHAFLGITLYLLLLKILPNIKSKIIDYTSNISYYIYLVHQIFILGTFSLLKFDYGILISIIIIFVLSNLLYYICRFINRRFVK